MDEETRDEEDEKADRGGEAFVAICEKADDIESKEDLTRFLFALKEYFDNFPDRWESITLSDYLEALAARLENYENLYRNRGEDFPGTPSWRFIGEFLLAASVYE